MNLTNIETITNTIKAEAEEIIRQLGGFGKLQAMIGASRFGYSGDNVTFKFKGSRKINYVKIQLTAMDDYTITFYKYSDKNFTMKEVKKIEGIYCDQLIEVFENTTGLYLYI